MPSIAELNALTQELYLPRITTNFGSEVPVLKALLSKGSKLQGGTSIRKSIAYQYTKGGAYGRGQVFDLSGEENFTAAEWTYRYYMWPTMITRQDQLENAGPSQVHDIMEAKVMVMKYGGEQDLANDFFTGGGTDSSLVINELDHALNDASDSLGAGVTYGGISKSTYSWWAGNCKDLDGTGGDHGPTYSNIKSGLALAHDADKVPNFLMAYSTTIDTFMQSQQSNQRYIADGAKGPYAQLLAGFKMAHVDGIPFVADNHIAYSTSVPATNRIYALNLDYFDLITHEKENFRVDGWKEPIDQAALVNKLFWAGNVVTWDPSRHVVIHDFDIASITT
ncbi:MAG: phage major capsid protein [Candidatus Krumholzibacteria bacterium]|nr:phage major capsid protein [Candidatus Krumholzibacteria bacterium]